MTIRNVEALTEPLLIGSHLGRQIIYTDGFRQFENGGYDDLRIELNPSRQGQNLKPAYDFTNCGLLFPQNDASAVALASEEFSHDLKSGTNIFPHIHFIQTTANIPTFKMLFRWYGNGSDVPAFTAYTANTVGVFAWTGNPMLQMVYFPEIPAITNGLSSHIDVKLFRDDNVVSGDVLAKFFDIHYKKDTHGSRTQSAKI